MRRLTQRIDPRLTFVLDRLEGTASGPSFRDRAVELAATAAFAEPIDYSTDVAAHRWFLERAVAKEGLALTAAGYLRPVDVAECIDVLPLTNDWPFSKTREVDVHPILTFREYLKDIRLLRKYKGTLRTTKAGAAGLADGALLWDYLAQTLLPVSRFAETLAIVVVVHMATSQERIDEGAIIRTMTDLGWSGEGGRPLESEDVWWIYNDMWTALGNVGTVSGRHRMSDRRLSPGAVALARDALFTEVHPPDGGGRGREPAD